MPVRDHLTEAFIEGFKREQAAREALKSEPKAEEKPPTPSRKPKKPHKEFDSSNSVINALGPGTRREGSRSRSR
jgi:hypothetical protein